MARQKITFDSPVKLIFRIDTMTWLLEETYIFAFYADNTLVNKPANKAGKGLGGDSEQKSNFALGRRQAKGGGKCLPGKAIQVIQKPHAGAADSEISDTVQIRLLPPGYISEHTHCKIRTIPKHTMDPPDVDGQSFHRFQTNGAEGSAAPLITRAIRSTPLDSQN